MLLELEGRATGDILTHLKEMRKTDSQRGEEKSKYLWQKQRKWYDDYKQNYGQVSVKKSKHTRPPNQNTQKGKQPYASNAITQDPIRPSYADVASRPPKKTTYTITLIAVQIIKINKFSCRGKNVTYALYLRRVF